MRRKRTWIAAAAVAVLAAAAIFGGRATAGDKSTSGKGGTMTLLAKAAPSGSPDPAIDYTTYLAVIDPNYRIDAIHVGENGHVRIASQGAVR